MTRFYRTCRVLSGIYSQFGQFSQFSTAAAGLSHHAGLRHGLGHLRSRGGGAPPSFRVQDDAAG